MVTMTGRDSRIRPTVPLHASSVSQFAPQIASRFQQQEREQRDERDTDNILAGRIPTTDQLNNDGEHDRGACRGEQRCDHETDSCESSTNGNHG